jgi:hypothetical protein
MYKTYYAVRIIILFKWEQSYIRYEILFSLIIVHDSNTSTKKSMQSWAEMATQNCDTVRHFYV